MIEYCRDILPGQPVNEEGIKCFGIHENRATIAGQLCKIENLFFIRSKTKRYNPLRYDIVMGRVIYVSQDYYKIDLAGHIGILPALSFQNATKRNRPNLNSDDYVMAQVARVENGEILLSCSEAGLGKIDEVFPIETWKVRLLYFSTFLRELGSTRTFKIGMGMNGFVWIDGDCKTKKEVLSCLESFCAEK